MEIVRKPEKRTQVIYNLLDWPDLPPFGIDPLDPLIHKATIDSFLEDLEKKLNELKNPWVEYRNGKFWLTPPPTSETWKSIKFKSANLRHNDSRNTRQIIFKSSIMNYGDGVVLESGGESFMDNNGVRVDLGENWRSRPIDIEIDVEFYVKQLFCEFPKSYEKYKEVFQTKSKTLSSLLFLLFEDSKSIVAIPTDPNSIYYNFEWNHDEDPNVAVPNGEVSVAIGLFLNVTWIG